MQRECNVVAFGELALHTRHGKKRQVTSKIQNRRCRLSVQLLNNVNVENDLLHKRVLPSQPVLQQIPQVFTKQYFNSSNMNLALETLNLTRIERCVTIKTRFPFLTVPRSLSGLDWNNPSRVLLCSSDHINYSSCNQVTPESYSKSCQLKSGHNITKPDHIAKLP